MLQIVGRALVFFGLGLFGARAFLVDPLSLPFIMLLLVSAWAIALVVENFTERKPKTIGERAVGKGILTMEDVSYVLNCQGDCGKRFGEIALEKGLMTERQLNRLMADEAVYQ